MSLTPCPACDGPLVLMVRCVGRYAYYRCTDCSLVTSLPMPSSEELQAFYDGFLFGAPDPREHELNQLGIQRNVRKILQDCRERGGLDCRLPWSQVLRPGLLSGAASRLG